MKIYILIISCILFANPTLATEVNGNFKDECKFLKNRIEKDIAYIKKYYDDNLKVPAIINKAQYKELLSYYKTLCD
jgi:hypothetical protein|tara:strand:- start:192 stop:419 length:228 start_codon:yes stop_codon:yes gene_type:complete